MKQHTKKGNQFSMLHGTEKKNWELIEQLYNKCTTKQRTNAFLLQVIWLKCMWEKSIPEPKLKWISKYADHHFATTQFILNAWTLLIFWLRVNLCVCVLVLHAFRKITSHFLTCRWMFDKDLCTFLWCWRWCYLYSSMVEFYKRGELPMSATSVNEHKPHWISYRSHAS